MPDIKKPRREEKHQPNTPGFPAGKGKVGGELLRNRHTEKTKPITSCPKRGAYHFLL